MMNGHANNSSAHDGNEALDKLISQASTARDHYENLLNTKFSSNSIQQKCSYPDIIAELVY